MSFLLLISLVVGGPIAEQRHCGTLALVGHYVECGGPSYSINCSPAAYRPDLSMTCVKGDRIFDNGFNLPR